jgi:hypothetical protein
MRGRSSIVEILRGLAEDGDILGVTAINVVAFGMVSLVVGARYTLPICS